MAKRSRSTPSINQNPKITHSQSAIRPHLFPSRQIVSLGELASSSADLSPSDPGNTDSLTDRLSILIILQRQIIYLVPPIIYSP